MPLTVEAFAQRVTSSGVMTETALRDWLASLPADRRPGDGEALARELVQSQKLTRYQAEQIEAGNERSLTLGNYVVLDKLGQGGMGMVLKAMHRRMERVVAIKVMSPQGMSSPDAVQRFHREVKAAAKLSHPNIVAAHDADEANGTHFLVMEYVEGSDLSALVRARGPLPMEQAVLCILQAARGLEFAHKRGVIHRDIKPANLLLDREGTVKILDMGLARIEDSVGGSSEGAGLTSTGTIMGTVDYMSPEQAMDTKSADARSDIYSLGCSLYYLLTGRCLYDGDTLMKKLMAHQTTAVPSLAEAFRRDSKSTADAGSRQPGMSGAALDSVFRRMVAKKPHDRPQSMTEVIALLEGCLSGSDPTMALGRSPGRSATGAAGRSSAGGDSATGNGLQDLLRQLGAETSSTTASVAATAGKGSGVSSSSPGDATMISSGDVETDSFSEKTALLNQAGTPVGAGPAVATGSSPTTSTKSRATWLVGSLVAAVVLLALVLARPGQSGTLVLEINDGKIEVTLGDTGRTVKGKSNHTLQVAPGLLKLQVERDGHTFETDSFDVPRGKPVSLNVAKVGSLIEVTMGDQSLGRMELAKESGSRANPAGAIKGASTQVAANTLPSPYEILTSADYEWTPPENLGPEVNTVTADTWPALSSDGLRLVFFSHGRADRGLCEATRTRIDEPFGPAGSLGEDFGNNSVHAGVSLSGDGLALVFASGRPGGPGEPGNLNLWQATRPDLATPFSKPICLRSINQEGDELNPWLSSDGLTIYFQSHRPGQGTYWMSRRASREADFAPPAPFELPLLPGTDSYSHADGFGLSSDERVLLFAPFYRLEGRERMNLLKFVRPSRDARFGTPVDLDPVLNGESVNGRPTLSADGTVLIFQSERPGGIGGQDLWTSRRVRKTKESMPSAEAMNPARSPSIDLLHHPVVEQFAQEGKGLRLENGALVFTSSEADGLAQVWVEKLQTRRGRVRAVLQALDPVPQGVVSVGWDYAGGNPRRIDAVLHAPQGKPAAAVWEFGPNFDVTPLVDEPIEVDLSQPIVIEHEFGEGLIRATIAGRTITSKLSAASDRKGFPYLGVKGTWKLTEWRMEDLDGAELSAVAGAPPPAIAPFDAQQARAHQEAWAKHLGVPVEYTNSIGMKFRLIPPGEFLMGSSPEEVDAVLKPIPPTAANIHEKVRAEAPQRRVVLTEPFYLGVHEVTQEQYAQLVGINPSHFAEPGKGSGLVQGLDTKSHPVESVSWLKATSFCTLLSKKERRLPWYGEDRWYVPKLSGTGYRLPTDAEWEFACRAGTTTTYWSGAQPDDARHVAWCSLNAQDRTHSVGELPANPFGLHDMHGNVWEFVEDGWPPSPNNGVSNDGVINPITPYSQKQYLAIRGGSWSDPPDYLLRSANHEAFRPEDAYPMTGMRLALSVDAIRPLTNIDSPVTGSPGVSIRTVVRGFEVVTASYRARVTSEGLLGALLIGDTPLIDCNTFRAGVGGMGVNGTVRVERKGTQLKFTQGTEYSLMYDFDENGFTVVATLDAIAATRDQGEGKSYYLTYSLTFSDAVTTVRSTNPPGEFKLPAAEQKPTLDFVAASPEGHTLSIHSPPTEAAFGYSGAGPRTWSHGHLVPGSPNSFRFDIRKAEGETSRAPKETPP